MAQAGEQVLVQAFIPQSAIEGLDEAVLHGFAGRDVVPFDFPVLLPRQDRVRGQFCAVVTDHHAGIAPQLGDPVEFPGHLTVRDRRVDDGTQDSRLKSISARGFQVPACVRHACARSAALRDRSGSASAS
jgi:hypothetical protein